MVVVIARLGSALLSTMKLVVASEFALCDSRSCFLKVTSIITMPGRLEPDTVSSGATTSVLKQ